MEKKNRYKVIYKNGTQQLEHHYIFLKHNPTLKEIPKGYVVHHIDGNVLNNNINNLSLMKWGEHSRFHFEKDKVNRIKKMIGRKFSEESKRKMSFAKKGKKFSKEHIQNLSIAHIGYVMPQSQKDKITHKMRIRKLSEEHKRKISEAITKWHKRKGHKLLEETNKRLVNLNGNKKEDN